MGAIIVKVGAETKKIAIDIPPNYNPIRFNDAGTVRGCRLVRPGMFNATPVHTMVDGRVMALAGNAVVRITDTYVSAYNPNTNYSLNGNLEVYLDIPNPSENIFFRVPPNKILNLYNSFWGGLEDWYLNVMEVDTASLIIETVTWNTQPTPGVLISSVPIHVYSGPWFSVPTGTSGAIMITIPSRVGQTFFMRFNSMETGANKPYITDP